ncbi:hypothetical protein JMA_27380 [Jeotgalibacillus malaysiensis]|uniref:Uncharacterized protein n=1 Tax=Jeotgalibacillus malaysiensis TaxID=1508404 RepID=A0A0B5AP56_9BACL|nr:hypothetical protein [Jeotgalibacillus malaysiensis]AJD92055.1 hypothetical protein JMA_27380 [Jeotgalibacillus malaysiensis]
MQIQLLYESAIRGKHKSLALMIDYVVNEKQVLTFKDHVGNLRRYMLPKNQPKMSRLLNEYLAEKRNNPDWPLYEMFKKDGAEDEVKKSQ